MMTLNCSGALAPAGTFFRDMNDFLRRNRWQPQIGHGLHAHRQPHAVGGGFEIGQRSVGVDQVGGVVVHVELAHRWVVRGQIGVRNGPGLVQLQKLRDGHRAVATRQVGGAKHGPAIGFGCCGFNAVALIAPRFEQLRFGKLGRAFKVQADVEFDGAGLRHRQFFDRLGTGTGLG